MSAVLRNPPKWRARQGPGLADSTRSLLQQEDGDKRRTRQRSDTELCGLYLRRGSIYTLDYYAHALGLMLPSPVRAFVLVTKVPVFENRQLAITTIFRSHVTPGEGSLDMHARRYMYTSIDELGV